MPSYFDDTQSTNSSDFGFTNSNASRIWASTGISSSVPSTTNSHLSSSNHDRDKPLALNRSNSTATTTGSGSPYYPSGLFSNINSPPSPSTNIDNNGNGNGNVNGNSNLHARINSDSLTANLPLNMNIRPGNNDANLNADLSPSPSLNTSLDRFGSSKYNQINASPSSTLNSLNMDNMNSSSVAGTVNSNFSKTSYGSQGFAPGPGTLHGQVPSHGLGAGSNPRGLHPQLHHQGQTHENYDHPYMQGQHLSHPSHSQLQPRQHHSDHLSNVMQGMHISSSHGHGHGAMQMSAHGMDPLEDVLGTFPCVCMRNLPYDANLQDVLIFFQGLVLLDVVVMPSSPYSHAQHNQAGEAFVLFANPMDFQMALQRNGLQMRHGGAQIDVFQGKRGDYYAAISSVHARLVHSEDRRSDVSQSHPRSQNQGTLWSGQGPGGNMGMHQSHGAGIGVQGQQGGMDSAGNMKYKSSQAQGAMPGAMNKGHARSGRGEGRKGSGGRGSGRGGGIQVGEHTGYLRMRGLPFTSTKKEIFDFFKAYDPVEESICLTYRSDGRATGEGYILFATPDHAKDAMALHRNSMGSRYIELFISNKDEHSRAQAREPCVED